jgi:hypothetical protein
MDEQERVQRGESPEAARTNARRDFGNALRPAEDVRETWGTAGMDRLLQDVTYAFRQRSPFRVRPNERQARTRIPFWNGDR